jgi:sugar lactone lactonase YvrE
MNIRSLLLSMVLVALTGLSCGFPPLPRLGESGSDGSPVDDGQTYLELLAGNIGGAGSLDRPGVEARFHFPMGIAVNVAGDLYVADSSNHTIRKVTATGNVTTMAGSPGKTGSNDGLGGAARFFYPSSTAIDRFGTLYVADVNNHIIRKITAAGNVTTLAGAAGVIGSVDGLGAAARFNRPRGVAVDSSGNVYVADSSNHTIRKISAAGSVATLAGAAGQSGSVDGVGATARFLGPTDVAVDSAGILYIADTGNHTIRKVDIDSTVSTLAGTTGLRGRADGAGNAATFDGPTGVAVDDGRNVYIADTSNHTIRKISLGGVVTTLAGTAGSFGSADGTGADARFHSPTDLAVDPIGNVYVGDTLNCTVRKLTPTGAVTTLAGNSGTVDGASGQTRISPAGLLVDPAGTVYVLQAGNRGTLNKISATGGLTNWLGDSAVFDFPTGLAMDSEGAIYLSESAKHTIHKISKTGVVTLFAGASGMSGSADGQGSAARFNFPTGLAVDRLDSLYVADTSNGTIRKITPTGDVTTLAGTPGMFGKVDGVGAAARFSDPRGLAVDDAGNVLVVDSGNHAVRKVAPDGAVSTLAGKNREGSADGEGALAQFSFPRGITLDRSGNIYIADQGNSTVRKIAPTGFTTTIAGTAGVKGIGLGKISNLSSPEVLAIFGDSIYIGDPSAVLVLRHGAR